MEKLIMCLSYDDWMTYILKGNSCGWACGFGFIHIKKPRVLRGLHFGHSVVSKYQNWNNVRLDPVLFVDEW